MKYTILKHLCGSVRFTAAGEFPERFINLAMRSNAFLWDIKRNEEGFSACVIAKRYKLLKSAARKTRTKIRICSKRGLPFRLLPYRHRVGFVLGFIFFCLSIWTLSNYIWIIDLPETDEQLSNKIISVSDSIGIRPGTLRSSLDGDALSALLEMDIDDLSWASVNIFGSKLSIEIREYEKFVSYSDMDTPCNLVAKKGGIIVDVRSFGGYAEVKKGDVVAAGDLLVSGVIENANGSVSLVHSQGSVIAQTDYRFVQKIFFEQTEPLTTGRCINIRRLTFLGLEIPLYIGKEPEGEFIKTREESSLKVGKYNLPISIIHEKWVETAEMTHMISERDAINRGLTQIDKRISELGDVEVISRSEYIETDKSGVTITVDFTVHQDIAVAENILFD